MSEAHRGRRAGYEQCVCVCVLAAKIIYVCLCFFIYAFVVSVSSTGYTGLVNTAMLYPQILVTMETTTLLLLCACVCVYMSKSDCSPCLCVSKRSAC